ncbi:MAG: hypothetical protein WC291_12610 [Thermodesulfovibrionales bacterium]|jgi:hypothetical protein
MSQATGQKGSFWFAGRSDDIIPGSEIRRREWRERKKENKKDLQ